MTKKLSVFLIFISIKTLSQNIDTTHLPLQYNYTEDFVFLEDFTSTINLFKELITLEPQNPVHYYRLGFAYLNSYGKQDSAIFFLKKALKLFNNKYRHQISPLEIQFYIARAYLYINIDSSLFHYYKLYEKTSDSTFKEKISKEIKRIHNILKINDLYDTFPGNVNSPYLEHSPILINDLKLLFTSKRPNPYIISLEDGQYAENIYISEKKDTLWTEPTRLDINTYTNNATCFLSYDHRKLLIYRDTYNGDIYISNLDSNGNWLRPERLPYPINTSWRETHASLSPKGDTIYFCSNRPGGYGGFDIWYSIKIKDKWTKPINAGPAINTKYNEITPNINYTNTRLYFASDRPESFGGYDIYYSDLNQFNTWTKAKNAGIYINSNKDEFYYYEYPNQKISLITTLREDLKSKSEILIFKPDTANVNYKIINIGYVFSDSLSPIINIDIIVKDNFNNIYKYKTDKNGKFIFITEPFNSYQIIISDENKVYFKDVLVTNKFDSKIVYYKKIILNDAFQK